MGCNKSWENPGPAATFEQFLMDLRRGRTEAAFEALAPEDRKMLTEPLEKHRDEVGEEALPKTSEMLVAGSVDSPLDFKDIEFDETLETEPEKGAVVELDLIYHDGRKGYARMVWGGERWYVDLPDPSQRESQSGDVTPEQ